MLWFQCTYHENSKICEMVTNTHNLTTYVLSNMASNVRPITIVTSLVKIPEDTGWLKGVVSLGMKTLDKYILVGLPYFSRGCFFMQDFQHKRILV